MNRQPRNPRPNWLNRFDVLLLGATAVLSGVVSLLDFLGVLDEVSWLAERIPTLTLLATGLVAAYLVLERRSQLESMQRDTRRRIEELARNVAESTTTIIESLEGVELRQFDGTDLLRYVNKRLLQARCQIDDLSWSPAVGLGSELNAIQDVNAEYMERVTQVAQRIPYREVFVFNRPGRVEKLKRRVEENSPGYSCAYYHNPQVPLLQFMVIDNAEVIVLSDQFQSNFALKHPYIVKLFSEYYEEIWKNATSIKLGTDIRMEVVEEILNKTINNVS